MPERQHATWGELLQEAVEKPGRSENVNCRTMRCALFRTLATLRVDVPVFRSIDDLLWRGAAEDFKQKCERMKAPDLFRRPSARESDPNIAVITRRGTLKPQRHVVMNMFPIS